MHSIGSVKANLSRISEETTSSYGFLLREEAESKLYYLRDNVTPEEFDHLVDQELRRSLAKCAKVDSNRQQFKHVAKSVKRMFIGCFR